MMNPPPAPSSSSFAATTDATSSSSTTTTTTTSTTTKLRTTTTRLEIKLPPGLPQLLEILARECIRSQPDNIVEYLATLTDELLEKRDGERLRDKAGAVDTSTEKVDVESQAAVKIQASYRGYKTRKDLQKVKVKETDVVEVEKGKDEESAAELEAPPEPLRGSIEEEAAIKIQSGVRGFLTRRRLKAQRSLNNNNSIEEYIEPTPVTSPRSDHDSPPADDPNETTERSDPDEYDVAVERILKEYGQLPDKKIENRTTSIDLRVQQLEAEIASLSSEKENQDLSADKSEKSESSLPMDVPEPETALALDSVDAKDANVTNESNVENMQDPEPTPVLQLTPTTLDDNEKAESIVSHETESIDSNLPQIDSDSSHSEESDVEQTYAVSEDGQQRYDTSALEENSVQLINAVFSEAKSIVKSMEEAKASKSESSENEAAVQSVSKEDSQSEPTSPREVIQVEISNPTPPVEDVADEVHKDSTNTEVEPVVTIPAVAKEESVESVPLRNRTRGAGDQKSEEDKVPEAPVVVRRSKRNTSNTETKYRSGFVEVSPEHENMQKSFEITMEHIDEGELDREIETEVMNNAAAKIQAGFRGFKARRTLNKAKASATCIQANFRGYKARRKIEQEKKAVVKIQATVRGFLARRRITKEKLANQSKRRKSSTGFKIQRRRSSTLNAAAIRIQSAYRGYTVRKNYKGLRQNSTSPVDLRIEDVGASQGDI